MHSNFFLKEDNIKDEEERIEQNRNYAKEAIILLIEAFKIADVNEKEIQTGLTELKEMVK